VLIPSVNGDLAPAVKVQERREQGENGTVESQETTLLPDGSGNWQTGKYGELLPSEKVRTAAARNVSSGPNLKAS